MKNSIAAIVIFLSIGTASWGAAMSEFAENNLKVLSWNIWHKGHSSSFPDIGCKNVIGILKHSNADVVIAIETYGAASMIADSLGFCHRLISDNLSIYSRYPIIKTYVFPDSISAFNFGGIKIDYNGTPVRIFNVWLNDQPDCRLVPIGKTEAEIIKWDEAGTRDDEIRTVLSVIKKMINEADSIPIIIGGDFNIHSHLDWTFDTKNMYKHGGAVVNWSVSKLMEQHGFKDSYREMNPNPATDIGVTWMYENKEKGGDLGTPDRSDRIDFMYYIGEKLKAVKSDIFYFPLEDEFTFKDKKFIYMSDHGFILTEFEVKNKCSM